MTTHLFLRKDGPATGTSKNLRGIITKAREWGGVSRITIARVGTFGRNEALVNVFYNNGGRACTNFASYSHAIEWAWTRSRRKGSWWEGCVVDQQPV